MFRTLAACLALMPSGVIAAEYSFCWQGGNDYTMTGTMTIADYALNLPLVTEVDVTRFRIQGFHEGVTLGAWDLSQMTGATTFHLRFDPASETFNMGGSSDLDYQAWNANGTATDCGNPGFGFNAGNNAQDLCVNGQWVTDSMIDRWTPLEVVSGPVPPPCGDTLQLSELLPN